MANEIKVTAQYETKSRLDNLERLSEIAKKATEEFNYAKTVISPIIIEEGKAKYKAICDQLTPYVKFIKDNPDIFNRNTIYFSVMDEGRYCRGVQVRLLNNTVDIMFGTSTFYNSDTENMGVSCFCGEYGVLTHWNELNFIESLELAIARMVKEYTDKTNRKAKAIYDNKAAMEN